MKFINQFLLVYRLVIRKFPLQGDMGPKLKPTGLRQLKSDHVIDQAHIRRL